DRANKVLKSMDAWETVCATFVADGGEEYLALGCFEADAKLKIEKNKRPRTVTGAQTYEAYYYIDDVSIVPVEAKSQCSCSSATSSQPDLIYGSAVVVTPEMTDEDILGVSAVYFPSLKKSVNSAGVNTLNKVIEMMKANPDWKLEIIGHSDNDEAAEAKINSRYVDLGKARAEQVKRYLVSKGIAENRLVVLTKENTDPATTRETPVAIAQNRRVTFAIRK
ncbi:MAG: OmpA family protein, partial [Bacteroidota bacterium]